jgi:hypothetical protein
MTTIRFITLVAAFLLAVALGAANTAWAQQKYTISRAPASTSQYLQQHAIDVDDSAGHQASGLASSGVALAACEPLNFNAGHRLGGERGTDSCAYAACR